MLVGDSTVRQIYWAIARKLDAEIAEYQANATGQHMNLSLERHSVNLQFIWDPFLNSTSLENEVFAYNRSVTSAGTGAVNTSRSPSIILVGGGLWHARYLEAEYLRVFGSSIDSVIPHIAYELHANRSGPSRETFSTISSNKDLFLIAPVQIPLDEALSPTRATTITPAKVDSMNNYLRQKSIDQSLDVLWSYNLMISEQKSTYEANGLHVIDGVADHKADVLLNLRCNAKVSVLGLYPFDRTCCSRYPQPNWIQLGILCFSLGLLPMIHFLILQGRLIILYWRHCF